MVSKMYLAMTLAMGLNNVFAEKASEPKYLWRECHTGSSRNVYDSQLEVDNVYENETIRMADYAGQVLIILILTLSLLRRNSFYHWAEQG